MQNKQIKKILILVFWLLVWEGAARLADNSIVFVGPLQVALALCKLLPTAAFWQSVGLSLLKIGSGFLGGFFLGVILGGLAYRYGLLEDFAAPLISLMKSVPVASFVILALIFMGSKYLAVIVVFTIVIPLIYLNTLAGFRAVDRQLLEMAQVFHIRGWKRIRYIYQPSLYPYLVSASRTAVGMSWKSGVAAEVIGVSAASIGEKLYLSKVYLETADLFAWTLVIIVLSFLCEKCFLLLLRTLGGKGVRR